MHTSNRLYLLIAGIVSLAAFQRAAAGRIPWSIRRADNGPFAGIGYGMWRDEETAGAVPVDSLSGGLTAYTVGLTRLGRHAGSLYGRLRLTGAFGTTRYQGNGALGLPAQGSTADRIASADARLGVVIGGLWRQDRAAVLIPYLGAGFQRGARGAGPGGIDPGGMTYTAGHLGIGLCADYALTERLVLSVHALTGYTLGAQVTTTVPIAYDAATGALESARITEPLGDRPYSVLGITIHYRVDRHLEIAFAVRRAAWSAAGAAPIPITGSSGQTVGVTQIPGSRDRETTTLIEAAIPF